MRVRVVAAVVCGVVVLMLGIALGSVWVSPLDIIRIVGHNIFGAPLPEGIGGASVAIVWNLRLPRTLLAFIVGSALSVSGAVMQ